jgi:hypothetical protein
MEINVKLEITRETLECIFVTAIEGGSNHWYWIHDDTYRLIRNYIPSDEEPCLSVAFFSAVYDLGITLPIHDVEDPDGDAIGYFDRFRFEERLQKCYKDYPSVILNEIDEEGDAHSSDIVFQYLGLGGYYYG